MSLPSSSWISIARSGVSRCWRPVEVARERDAVVVDAAPVGEAEDLEAA